MSDYAETVLQQRFSTIDGVAQVLFWGQQRYAVRIQVNPDKLVTRNLSLQEVEAAIKAGNSNLPTGSLSGRNTEMSINTTGALDNASGYNNLVVAKRNGCLRPSQGHRPGDRRCRRDQVVDMVRQRPGHAHGGLSPAGLEHSQDRRRDQSRCCPRSAPSLPAAVDLQIMYDRSNSIRESIEEVEFTLMLAAALVVMVIFLFLRNLRATLIASIALPISVIGTFSVMYALGFSLNNLSLMALTLSVGFVVDDAIVMLENIMRHREKGDAGDAGGARSARAKSASPSFR